MRYVLLASLCVAGCATDAPPGDETSETSQSIVIAEYGNAASGRCLDAQTQSIDRNGTVIQLWDCTAGASQQLWIEDTRRVNGVLNGTIQSLASGRCLDAQTQSIDRNGTVVQLWDCNPGAVQQLWQLNPDGSISNVRSGRCLDAQTQSIGRNGTVIQLWDCNGGANQRWF